MNPLKTFFYSLKKSLFDPKYYKEDVVKANFWFSYKYLFVLIFLLTLIKGLFFGMTYLRSRPYIKPEVNNLMSYAQNFYPQNLELKIKNGQLSTNAKEPYVFDLEKNRLPTDRHVLIIDTKGSIDNYPNYNTYILATKNAVVYPSKSESSKVKEISVFYFHDLKQNFTLNRKGYNGLLDMIRPYTNKALYFVDWVVLSLSPLFLIFGSFFWTSGVMFGLLFLTFFVWIVNLIFKKGYNYGSLYRMGMHAVTWPILLNEVFGYIRSPFPRFYSWIFLAWMLVVLFQRSPSKKRA